MTAKILKLLVISTISLSACTSANFMSTKFENMTTQELWTQHVLSSSPQELALVEAELGSRGEMSRLGGYTYLGEKTASQVGKKLYGRSEVTSSDVNCGDFPSAASAQKYFLTHGGPASDPNGLDRDGDGLACEWGGYLKKSVRYASSQRATRRASTSSRCYRGPRGGTYTITASGRKNYGGC